MGGLMMLVVVLALSSHSSLSNAEIHMSSVAQHKKEHMVFLLYKSSEAIFPCDEGSTKNSSCPFATHQLPDGAVLNLCLEHFGGLCGEYMTSSEVRSDFGLELVDVERKLHGTGAHRELRTSIALKTQNIETCHIVIVERLSSGVFADMFELERLVARGAYAKAVIYGDHNLELPALHSSESMVVIHKSFKMDPHDSVSRVQVGLPLHARYPPLSSNSHVAVGFNFPILLFRCSDAGNDDSASGTDVCSNDVGGEKSAWALLTRKEASTLDATELQWLVPAGNPRHTRIVSALTACTSLLGVLMLWMVSKHSYQSRKIKVT